MSLNITSALACKTNENNYINNIFDTNSILKERFLEKTTTPELTFKIKSNSFNTNEFTAWLNELLEKNSGEMVLSLETSDAGKRFTDTLALIEEKLNISITIQRERTALESNAKENECVVAVDLLIRRNHTSEDFIEVRVAIVGNVGKLKFSLSD